MGPRHSTSSSRQFLPVTLIPEPTVLIPPSPGARPRQSRSRQVEKLRMSDEGAHKSSHSGWAPSLSGHRRVLHSAHIGRQGWEGGRVHMRIREVYRMRSHRTGHRHLSCFFTRDRVSWHCAALPATPGPVRKCESVQLPR